MLIIEFGFLVRYRWSGSILGPSSVMYINTLDLDSIGGYFTVNTFLDVAVL